MAGATVIYLLAVTVSRQSRCFFRAENQVIYSNMSKVIFTGVYGSSVTFVTEKLQPTNCVACSPSRHKSSDRSRDGIYADGPSGRPYSVAALEMGLAAEAFADRAPSPSKARFSIRLENSRRCQPSKSWPSSPGRSGICCPGSTPRCRAGVGHRESWTMPSPQVTHQRWKAALCSARRREVIITP